MQIRIIFTFCAGLVILNSCASSIGDGLATGASNALLRRDSELTAMVSRIAGAATAAARDSALTPAFTQSLALALDSVITRAGGAATKQAVGLRDSLLGSYLLGYTQQLKDGLLGDGTRRQLAAIRTELLGAQTGILVGLLRDNLLGDKTKTQIAALRDELIGPNTNVLVDSLISHAMAQAAIGYRTNFQPILHEEEGWLQRNATTLAWTGGGIIALLLGLGAWLFRKYSTRNKMLNLITYQIHDMEDQKQYDELTDQISRKAKEAGVEGELRSLLKKRGLLNDAEPTPEIQIA